MIKGFLIGSKNMFIEFLHIEENRTELNEQEQNISFTSPEMILNQIKK